MNQHKIEDFMLKQISFIRNIDNEIKLSIGTMFEYINEIECEISKNSELGDFSLLINEIKNIGDCYNKFKS